MSEASVKCDINCDKIKDEDKSIKSKQCNKFSIENILGLNDDDPKVNRLELMNLCQKGKKEGSEGTCTFFIATEQKLLPIMTSHKISRNFPRDKIESQQVHRFSIFRP